ncbi:MAG: hypothetical protein HY568_01235 [Candidatus Latescibacteria bacterium]|nr:hypothetical protein [Candidatus Latescibacterota bacterium]
MSCGTKAPTQPGLDQSIVASAGPERFLSSPQGEARELLLDGRATDIEWNIAGSPAYVLLRGADGGGGGDFYVAVRTLWSYDPRFGDLKAFYLLLQWPDRSADYQDRPIVNDSIDILDDSGNLLVDCRAGNDALVRPRSWHRSPIEEDQVVIEIFSDSLGSYPADNWRWGAGTTDPIIPSSPVEFLGAITDGDTLGATVHPAAGFADDRWDLGGGPVDDVGRKGYFDNFTLFPDGIVPNFIASKGTRDTRLNRAKPTAYTIWSYVAKPLTSCDSLNPARVDDSGIRDKTWNPGDIVPSRQLIFPSLSQLDVLARGSWADAKWELEIRRNLRTYFKPPGSENDPSQWVPWSDDLVLEPGRRYMMRITVFDGSSTRGSRSALLPLYLRPRT